MIDDDGFVGYLPTTEDPGYSLLIATTLFCLASNLMMPCAVSLGRRYERKRLARQLLEQQDRPAGEENRSEQPASHLQDPSKQFATNKARTNIHDDTASSVGPNSYVHGSSYLGSPKSPRSPTGMVQDLLDKLIMPPYPDDAGGFLLGKPAFSVVSSSAASEATDRSSTSRHVNTSFLDVGYGAHSRCRRALTDAKQRRKEKYGEDHADAEYRNNAVVIHRESTSLTGEIPHRGTDGASDLSSQSRADRRQRSNQGAASCAGSVQESGHGAPSSIMSKLDDHVITPGDAADADDPGHYNLPKPGMEGDEELDLCSGKHAWWKPAMLAAGFDRIVAISEWDYEMKRIVKLSIPYTLKALLLGINQTITVAIISQFVGTEAVVAFVLVELLLGMSFQFFGGIVSTEATLCSQAVGARNYKLAGQYVQICAIIFSVCSIPNTLVWFVVVDDVLMLFGFNDNVARIGHAYAVVLLFRQWLSGVNNAYHELLNVIDHEKWSTFMGVLEDTLGVLVIVAVVTTKPDTSLQEIGLIKLAVSIMGFIFNCWFTVYKGWMNKYLEGMIGSFALTNRKAVWAVIKTGIPVSIGFFIEYAEWEILTIFAAIMGPAEVAAWGLIGSVWTTFETLTEGIGDGGEVRCAYHLGAGNPGMARLSAYKCILLGVVASCFFTSILFIIGENIAVWLTPDPTLQHMIADLLPLMGLGNIALTAGTVSWALVGAQGRYRLATLVAFIFSWGITMPLSALFTFGLNMNLQGITASVVVGYSVTGTILIYIVLRSDWERLSRCVIELNELEDEELDQFRPEGFNRDDESSEESSSEEG